MQSQNLGNGETKNCFNMKKVFIAIMIVLTAGGCCVSNSNLAIDDPHFVNKKMGELYQCFSITEDSTYFYQMKKVDEAYWNACSYNARIIDSKYGKRRLVDTNQTGDIRRKCLPGLEVINEKGEWESPTIFLDSHLRKCNNPKRAEIALVSLPVSRIGWFRLTFEDKYGNTIHGIPEDFRSQFTHYFSIK